VINQLGPNELPFAKIPKIILFFNNGVIETDKNKKKIK
jgi:hypothetical protein